MTDLVWTPVKIRLGQIKPWSLNPRMSSKAQAQRLIKSERDLGQIQTLAVSPMVDGFVDLYDGHQRCSAWLTVKEPSFEVLALQSNRPLTEDERRKVSVTLHTATGSWDWDALSSWSAADLHEWGMDKDLLKEWNNEANNLKELINAEQSDNEGEEKYTTKVNAPVYEIKGEKPELADLYTDEKTSELLAEIDAADIPESDKSFLRIAATRHTVFNFQNIAEYYAHSPAPVQRLMENSALVIIDFDRAIELGYVKLTEEIKKQFAQEHPDD